MIVAHALEFALLGLPLTLDLSVWYSEASFLVLLAVMALAVYGFRVSLAGRPLFRDELSAVG